MFNDDDRRVLYEDLETNLGSRSAAILMAHLPPVGWAELATRADLDVQMAQFRVEMAELRAEIHSLLPKLIAANIASMIGVAGLVLAATSLAA